ncbi:hypothetical protein DJ532_13570 [Sulfolobus sp. A20-N-F8]|nr:hypothetical protein DJ532_13570 [Sulfolobus sp. A20-N-F8]
MGVARELLDEISKDEKLYDELVRKVAIGIARNDEVRMLILNSIIRDIGATIVQVVVMRTIGM